MPDILTTIIIYFFLGLMQDLLITAQTIAIIDNKVFLSGILAIANTIMAVVIFHDLLARLGINFLFNTLAYAVGGGLGVTGTVWYKRYRKRKSNNKRNV